MDLASPVKWVVSLFDGKDNLVNVIICLLWSDAIWLKVITLSDTYSTEISVLAKNKTGFTSKKLKIIMNKYRENINKKFNIGL